MRILRYLVITLVCLAVGCSSAADGDAKPAKTKTAEAETVVIPLNKIWGRSLPGTQDIKTLEPDHFKPAGVLPPEQNQAKHFFNSLSRQIYLAIDRRAATKQPIGPGFAVAGSGHDALKAAKEIMEQDQIPPQTFPVGTEISLFFFTRGLGMGFKLKEVRQLNETVTIGFQFGSYNTSDPVEMMSAYRFALIPLGKPASGNIAVNMTEQPPENKLGNISLPISYQQRAEKGVCKSFTFTIKPADTEAEISNTIEPKRKER